VRPQEVVDISSRRIIELDLYTLRCITLGIKVQQQSGRAKLATAAAFHC
jgi:hypothetical protein